MNSDTGTTDTGDTELPPTRYGPFGNRRHETLTVRYEDIYFQAPSRIQP